MPATDQTLQRKLAKQSVHGGMEADFIARYSAELLADKLGAYAEQLTESERALLLYARELRDISMFADSGLVFDSVPFSMVAQPAETLRNLLPGGQYSIVVCNLAFDWVDAGRFIALLDYLLKPGGVFWFSCYGSLTAASSRALLANIDSIPRFTEFYELQDIGDALAGTGFRNVVLESSMLDLEYTEVEVLLKDIERVFGLNQHPEKSTKLTSPGVMRRFRQAVARVVSERGEYTEQVEILTAFGVKPDLPGIRGSLPVRQA